MRRPRPSAMSLTLRSDHLLVEPSADRTRSTPVRVVGSGPAMPPRRADLKFVAGDNCRFSRAASGDELGDLLGSLIQIARGSPAPPVVRHSID
jgi:hypothetical protein